MPAITQEQVFAVDDRKRERVDVPEWGEDAYLYVREFSGLARAAWEEQAFDDKGNLRAGRLFNALTVVWCAEDDAGNPVFSEDAIDRLAREKNAVVVARIAEAALKVNSLLPDSVENAVKNFEADPNDSFTSS
jgi:hypothetical protein